MDGARLGDQRGFGAASNRGYWPGTEALTGDVRAAVQDWQAMRQRLQEAIADMASPPSTVPAALAAAHGTLAKLGLLADSFSKGRKVNAFVVLNVVAASHAHFFAVQGRGHAVRHHVFHMGVLFGMLEAFFIGLANNGAGHGMGKMLLKAGHDAQHFIPLKSLGRNNLNQIGRAHV